MAGIYLHIPFCKQACHYCNFHFSTSLKLQNDFLDALLKEVPLRRNYIGDEVVKTIYFGGGTPSLLTEMQVGRIMESLYSCFNIDPEAEITFEANPDDINTDRLKSWKIQGINRLSIGIQSFFDEDLLWMNRAHNAGQAMDSVKRAQDAGLFNMSIDLIYGTPTLSDEKWQRNMLLATDLKVPHLSCYALTVESGTALDALTQKNKIQPVNNEDQARQFLMMTDLLISNGYEHYEISNFSIPGMRSIHNSSYWSGEKYLGLGPSSHSFNGISRQWNIANNALYIKALKDNEVPFEMEVLTNSQQYNEYIMTSLRTIEGTDTEIIERKFGIDLKRRLIVNAKKFTERGWLESDDYKLKLTREGKLFADGIASDLFVTG